jgi:DNA anti-recombination protein RmuC
MRSGTTFKKRQKELARMEKQRDKAARRMQRKAEKLSGESSGEESPSTPKDDIGEPPDAISMPAGE